MRFFIFLSFIFLAGASLASQSHVEASACVKSKETRALFMPPSLKKQAAKSKRKTKRSAAATIEPGVVFPKYTPFRWMGKNERGWLEVRAMDGRTYWVRKRDISFQLQCLAVQVSKSRMYEGPGNQFPKSEVAERGDVFLDLGGEDGWTQVEDSEGAKAWINLDHVWKANSRIRMSFTPDGN